jgi:hypothetical protein
LEPGCRLWGQNTGLGSSVLGRPEILGFENVLEFLSSQILSLK